MTTKFQTKVGGLRYNVRERIYVEETERQSSLGYKDSKQAARELRDRCREQGNDAYIVDAEGNEIE